MMINSEKISGPFELLITYSLVIADVIVWGYFLKEGIHAVAGLYTRGYCGISDIVMAVIIPLIALLASFVAPFCYRKIGRKHKGLLIAFMSMIIFWIYAFVVIGMSGI